MKKISILAALICLMLSSVVYANTEKGYISTNTTANREVAPDTVEISIAIVTTDIKSMQIATIQNKELSDKLYNTMKTFINTENGDYVKTSDYNAQPIYTYYNGKRNFEKYQVSNRIIVHTKSIDKAGDIIDKAITLGATNIDNLSFTLSSYENYCDELLSQAAQKSKFRAENIAKSLGTTITGIKSVNGSCNTNSPTQRVMFNMMSKAEMSDNTSTMGSTPISTGTIKIYANINANYFVK